jgi:hypothetical protein
MRFEKGPQFCTKKPLLHTRGLRLRRLLHILLQNEPLLWNHFHQRRRWRQPRCLQDQELRHPARPYDGVLDVYLSDPASRQHDWRKKLQKNPSYYSARKRYIRNDKSGGGLEWNLAKEVLLTGTTQVFINRVVSESPNHSSNESVVILQLLLTDIGAYNPFSQGKSLTFFVLSLSENWIQDSHNQILS